MKSILSTSIGVLAFATLALPASAAPTVLDADYAIQTYYAHGSSDILAGFDWSSAGDLFYMTSTPFFTFGGVYQYDGALNTILAGNGSTFAGNSVTSIGDFIYFNTSDLSNTQYIYSYGTSSLALTQASTTPNYSLHEHQGRLFLTGVAGPSGNQVFYSDLGADGDLLDDPAISLGVTPGNSGPLAFDAEGNLYYAPGFNSLQIFRWSAAELTAAIADPVGDALETENHLWFDYSSLYPAVGGASSMTFDAEGDLLVTLTSFSDASYLAEFGVSAEGTADGSVESILSYEGLLGQLRTREGEVYMAAGDSIYRVIPEPASAALLAFGVLALGVRRRRSFRCSWGAALLITAGLLTAQADAAPTVVGAGYAIQPYYSQSSDSIVSFDWSNNGDLFYMATTEFFSFAGLYRYDGSTTSTAVAGNSRFSGASVVNIGNFIYFNDSDFSNNQFIYAYNPDTSSLLTASTTINYSLHAHEGRLFITGASGMGTNQIFYSDLEANGDLQDDPAINLGSTSGSSGPLGFDADGNLYYAPGFSDLSIYKWSAQELADAIANPIANPLNVDGHLWVDYSADYPEQSGGTSLAFDADGDLLVTLTSFSAPSYLVEFGVDAEGDYTGASEIILSDSGRLGEIRERDGELYIASGSTIYQIIPEPATGLMLAAGALFLAGRRRGRRRAGTGWAALLAVGLVLSSYEAHAGPYTTYSGGAGPDTPIAVSSITTWATSVADYSPAPGVGPNFRNTAGPNGTFFSLGDLYNPAQPPATGTEPSPFHAGNGAANFHPFNGNVNDPTDTYGFFGIDAPGSVTFHFPLGIYDGPGPDLAVRENGFASGPAPGFFNEFAFVEVSSNGSDFLRFPTISLNTAPISTAGTFQLYDMTNVYNLAGKHAPNLATPFDLSELSTDPLVLDGTVDLDFISYIRLVDVIGQGTADFDSEGRGILDNWVTFDSGGFDIQIVGGAPQAVGVLHVVPEPSTAALLALAATLVAVRRRSRG